MQPAAVLPHPETLMIADCVKNRRDKQVHPCTGCDEQYYGWSSPCGFQNVVHTQAHHPAARKPGSGLPGAAKEASGSPVHSTGGRKLGFHDPQDAPAPAAAQPAPAPSEQPAADGPQITDSMSVAVASMISSGEDGLQAARTVCAVVTNVIKAPQEAKYRRLNWYSPSHRL
jgi:hypothetical protein